MFGAVFVACFVASIGRIMWPVDKGYSGMVSGQNWRVPELPRSSLACWFMWLGSKLQLSGTQLRGTHAIVWLGDLCHSRCIGINKIYILNSTAVAELLQYSGSRVEHGDELSSYK